MPARQSLIRHELGRQRRSGNQQELAIANTIERLIPGAIVRTSLQTESWLDTHLKLPPMTRKQQAGVKADPNCVWCWYRSPNGHLQTYTITRDHIPFTAAERKVLAAFRAAVAPLITASSDRATEAAQKLAARLSLGHILVYRFLRRGKAATFWTPTLILTCLQDLTYRRYEGQMCTSGFVFTSQPLQFCGSAKNRPVDIDLFASPVTLHPDHFSYPTTFRYVDGRNSFYLIDNFQTIHGVIRLREPSRYSIVDRCAHRHIEDLVSGMPGRTWAAYTGHHLDVCVTTGSGCRLSWSGNDWQVKDAEVLQHLLRQHGCDTTAVSSLDAILLTLSELRIGSVILIPNDERKRPPMAGAIDRSDVGAAIRQIVVMKSLAKLLAAHVSLGIFGSDGLTTVSKTGTLLGCGEIVDVSLATQAKQAGGGRTQAAIAASHYGMAIKVSEDGPISVYRNGKLVIRF